MARPKKEKELACSHLIVFRLTDVEYDLVTRIAMEAGLSASTYIRKLLLDGKVNITYEVVADVPELQKLAAEFGKIGSNLNRIARYFHMGGINCEPMLFDKECEKLNAQYHKNQNYDDIKSHHYILSFDPKDKDDHGLTGEQAQTLWSGLRIRSA